MRKPKPEYSEEYNERVRLNAGYANPQTRGKRRKSVKHQQTPREDAAQPATPGGIPRRR
jgi:hypothetical protein